MPVGWTFHSRNVNINTRNHCRNRSSSSSNNRWLILHQGLTLKHSCQSSESLNKLRRFPNRGSRHRCTSSRRMRSRGNRWRFRIRRYANHRSTAQSTSILTKKM